jgi:hypothetical protein
MAFTYDVTTDRGKVRLLIGDTDSNNALLQDDEIDFFLTDYSGVYMAASAAAMAIAGKFARLADTTVEEVSKSYSQQQAQYNKLSSRLEAKALKVANNIPNAAITGISRDNIRDNLQKEDRVREQFYTGKFDNPPNTYEDDDFYRYQ